MNTDIHPKTLESFEAVKLGSGSNDSFKIEGVRQDPPMVTSYARLVRLGDQLVSGRLDLLLTDAEGAIVIDHKSFLGARNSWEAKAVGYGAQLGLYAEAVTAATGMRCDRLYVHMPLVGVLLRVAPL